jgi:D-sedoheptulose 7-phosphate isomerase
MDRRELFVEQLADHQRVVEAARTQLGTVERIAERISRCFEAGGRLYLCGNGGSAADAQHIAAELVGRYRHDRKALPAIALTTDTSILTAVANDLGAEVCFSRQVEALVTSKDLLWALSVSGRSPNVLRALEAARNIGAGTIGFTGRDGEPLRKLCDLSFTADHDRPDRVQEVHQLAYHLVCGRIEEYLRIPDMGT